jgi:hypothetical protein
MQFGQVDGELQSYNFDVDAETKLSDISKRVNNNKSQCVCLVHHCIQWLHKTMCGMEWQKWINNIVHRHGNLISSTVTYGKA